MTEARGAPQHALSTAVQRALGDPEIRDGLAHHAAARLGAAPAPAIPARASEASDTVTNLITQDEREATASCAQ